MKLKAKFNWKYIQNILLIFICTCHELWESLSIYRSVSPFKSAMILAFLNFFLGISGMKEKKKEE